LQNNREIKFRAWDKKNGMTTCFAVHASGLCAYMNNEWLEYSETPILMQYTGLKDKNGKDIYEGDILSPNKRYIEGKQFLIGVVQVKFGKYDDSEIDYGSVGVGWYVTGYHGYKRSNGSIDKYNIGDNKSDWSIDSVLTWEIIGNIHTNPELLEGKDDEII